MTKIRGVKYSRLRMLQIEQRNVQASKSEKETMKKECMK